MSKVSRLQMFATSLFGIRNAAMDIYERWVTNDASLGPQRTGPLFEDYVSGPTDLDGLWAWLQETGSDIDEETFKERVEEEGIDAFRPDETFECDWQEDIATGISHMKELVGRGLANEIIPPPGKDSKQWLMEVIGCAEEAKELVILAGLTPRTLECESDPCQCTNPAAARRHACAKQEHDRIEQMPAVADRLLNYRQWILTQVCVEGTSGTSDSTGEECPPQSRAIPTGSGTGKVGRFGYGWLLGRPQPPSNFEEALDIVLKAVERHRLLFLYSAEAHRVNPRSTQATSGIRDTIRTEDISGWDALLADIDDEGEFLFRNRIVLERFAQTAVREFGLGKGRKPTVPGPGGRAVEVEGGSVPYWSIDAEMANYLEESADGIIDGCKYLRSMDRAGRWHQLIAKAIEVAHDGEQPRWYASGCVHWEYLAGLDQAISAMKRAKIDIAKPGEEQPAIADDKWYILFRTPSMAWTPALLVDDFVKKEVDLLIQLLEQETWKDGEPHEFTAVAYSELEKEPTRLIRLRRQWTQIQPYLGEFDFGLWDFKFPEDWKRCVYVNYAATTYAAEIREIRPEIDDAAVPSPDSAKEEEKGEDFFSAIPALVIGILTLKTLNEAYRLYPTNIDTGEAKALHGELVAMIELTLERKGFEKFKALYRRPALGNLAIVQGLVALQAALLAWHPEVEKAGTGRLEEGMDAAMRKCQEDIPQGLLPIITRVYEIVLNDCRIPHPANDSAYQDQRRYFQLLREYWGLSKEIMLTRLSVPIRQEPHALTRVIVNLRSRLDSCFEQLSSIEGMPEAQRNVGLLWDTLLSDDPDEFVAVPEWTTGLIHEVEMTIETAGLKIGSTGFQLTNAETSFIDFAKKATRTDRALLQRHWDRVLKAATPKEPASQGTSDITTIPNSPAMQIAAIVEGGESTHGTLKRPSSGENTGDKLPYKLIPPNKFQWGTNPEIALTLKEWRLLEHLLRSPTSQVQDVIDAVWGGEADGDTGKLDTALTRLRKKLMPAKHPVPITLAHTGDYVTLTFDPQRNGLTEN